MPLTITIGFFTTLFSAGMALILNDQGVQCDPRQMHVFFNFAEPFVGVVYARDHHNDEACRVYGSGDRKLSLSVLLNVDPTRKPYCGVHLNKSAHEFSVQLLINSARDILVDGLSEFEVRCVYHLKDVTVKLPAVNGGLRISPAESSDHDLTVIQSAGAGMSPLMDMQVRLGHGIDGKSVQSALIGQPITLDVFTDNAGGAYDFFLYNCMAHNGKRSVSGTVTLLDSNGCAVVVDRVLTDPVKVSTGANGSKHVFLQLRGFQFSDADLVYFECQVRPCLNECNTTQCQSDTSRASRLESSKKWARPFDEENRTVMQSQDDRQPLSVQAKVAIRSRRQLDQPLIVGASEVDDLVVAGDDPQFLANEKNDEVCIPKVLVISVIILFVLGCALVFAVSMYTWYKMRRELDDKHKSAPRTGANVFSSSLCD